MLSWIVSIWLVIGIGYATTTMAAELYWKRGYSAVENAMVEAKGKGDATLIITTALAKGTQDAEVAAKLAPEIYWIRSSLAQIATENPMMEDTRAIEFLQQELVCDPYNHKWLMFLALRLRHSDRMAEASEVYKRVAQIWPDSPPERYLRNILGPFK